jgi:hypothetical protein
MGEPATAPTLVEPVEEAVGGERRNRVFGRPKVFSCERSNRVGFDVAERMQPIHPRCMCFIEVEHPVEARQHAFPLRQAWVVALDGARVDALIRVAEESRLVSASSCSERDVVESSVERRAVGNHPVVHLIHPGVQRCPARRARGGLAEVASESGAVGGEFVQCRCLHHRVTRHAQAVPSELIKGDEQHVGVHDADCSQASRSGERSTSDRRWPNP